MDTSVLTYVRLTALGEASFVNYSNIRLGAHNLLRIHDRFQRLFFKLGLTCGWFSASRNRSDCVVL